MTRYSEEDMDDNSPRIEECILKSNCETASLSKTDLERFREWKLPFDFQTNDCLTREGENEMRNLAKRMHIRFPTILPSQYDPEVYRFNCTSKLRTLQSAKYYADGLFGQQIENIESNKTDHVLRFYKLCRKWQIDVKQNPFATGERKLYEESCCVKNAISKINSKVGMTGVLSFDDLDLLYKTCAIEIANNKSVMSPWCTLFDNETIKVMEFAEDLKHYWLDGYGYNITHKQVSPTFKHLMDFFENDAPNPKAVLNFTHSSTLLKLFTYLNLYRDEKPLRHSDFETRPTRQWQLSKIAGFGSNVSFILYQFNDANKILVLHQERIIRLPCCPQSDLCDLDVVKKYYCGS